MVKRNSLAFAMHVVMSLLLDTLLFEEYGNKPLNKKKRF